MAEGPSDKSMMTVYFWDFLHDNPIKFVVGSLISSRHGQLLLHDFYAKNRTWTMLFCLAREPDLVGEMNKIIWEKMLLRRMWCVIFATKNRKPQLTCWILHLQGADAINPTFALRTSLCQPHLIYKLTSLLGCTFWVPHSLRSYLGSQCMFAATPSDGQLFFLFIDGCCWPSWDMAVEWISTEWRGA